jgi:hypothetical protein
METLRAAIMLYHLLYKVCSTYRNTVLEKVWKLLLCSKLPHLSDYFQLNTFKNLGDCPVDNSRRQGLCRVFF